MSEHALLEASTQDVAGSVKRQGLPGRHLSVIWQLPSNYLTVSWQLSGSYLAVIWQLSGRHLAVIWQLSGGCWQLSANTGSYLAATCPQLRHAACHKHGWSSKLMLRTDVVVVGDWC